MPVRSSCRKTPANFEGEKGTRQNFRIFQKKFQILPWDMTRKPTFSITILEMLKNEALRNRWRSRPTKFGIQSYNYTLQERSLIC